ncbi:MAG: 3'-5' exonuclease [Bacteriovoracaceae bacterium]|jgi:DNA polymerase III epsilon subunit family exonuclease|nr:3'-5' exonuclease [Bacteriovoracaceae bacterium]
MQRTDNVDINLHSEDIKILLDFFPNGVVAFDLEMTGLSPLFDKVIEIAAIKLNPDGSCESFHELINPLITIPEHTIQYHGLTNADLKDSPTFKLPLRQFNQFFGDLPLIAHNAQFDIGYIIRGNHEYNYKFSKSSVFDSCKFARTVYKKIKDSKPDNFKLSTLSEYFNIPLNHHRALDDAIASLRVFAKCLRVFRTNYDLSHFKDFAYFCKLSGFKRPEEYILPRKLEPLRMAITDGNDVKIVYKGGTSGMEPRNIKPISLLPMPQGLVLYALCRKSDHNKHFLVKKIKSVSS